MASRTQIVVLLLCSVLSTVAAAESNPELVRGKPGEEVTLDSGVTELKESDWIVWSYGLDVLVKYIDKALNGSNERFQLDTETASLTIKNVSANDSGSYLLQILNGNTTRRRFNLTVEGSESVLSPITAETSPGRTYWFSLIAASLFILLVVVLVVLYWRARKEVKDITRAEDA